MLEIHEKQKLHETSKNSRNKENPTPVKLPPIHSKYTKSIIMRPHHCFFYQFHLTQSHQHQHKKTVQSSKLKKNNFIVGGLWTLNIFNRAEINKLLHNCERINKENKLNEFLYSKSMNVGCLFLSFIVFLPLNRLIPLNFTAYPKQTRKKNDFLGT